VNESLTRHIQAARTLTRVVRIAGLGLVLALAFAATGFAATRSPVPSAVKAQIRKQKPALAYAPARMAVGFRYDSWHSTTQTVQISFVNKAGWSINFIATPSGAACRDGMEKSFQLDGNKVYWSHTGAEQQAWRCVAAPGGRYVRLVASSPQPPSLFADVGLGLVVASGARIK